MASRPNESGSGMDSSGQDQDDMAKVMGFANFGGTKKARQFDFMAMFEQTKKTAVERSQNTLAEREEAEKDQLLKSSYSKSAGSSGRVLGPAGPPPAGRTKATGSDSEEDSDSELIGPAVPDSLHRDSGDEELIGPPLPPGMTRRSAAREDDDEEDDDKEEEDEDDANPLKSVPSSHEVSLEHGNRTVSALALDPSGARLVSGGYDYEVRFWDFAGMDASLQAFRTIRPCESHPIRSVEYSATGDNILVVAGSAQAKVIDRDGFEVLECVKGDQYIHDKANTKGHTAMLNSGCWHPKIKEEFMTCSHDCTLRLWDVNNEKRHKSVLKPKASTGRVTIPTTCAYSRDGKYIAAACQDGSIQIWQHGRNYVNTSMKNMNCHVNGTDTSSLCFSYDGRTLASRGGDDTVKLWDIRSFKKPLCVAENLLNLFPMTDCVFSPDDRMLATGVSVRKGEGTGRLVFLDRLTLQTVSEMDIIEGSSVVRFLWHPRLNQIVVGCGEGTVKVYYDPDKSHRGALLCVMKKKKKAKQVQMLVAQNVLTPHALPMFRAVRASTTKKQEEKSRKDPVKSHRPDLPVAGPGEGGRVANKGGTLSQYVVQQLVMRKPDERDKDPRAAILRHAKEAAENPFWVDPAYKDTQPVPVFQKQKESSDEEDEEVQPVWKKSKIQ